MWERHLGTRNGTAVALPGQSAAWLFSQTLWRLRGRSSSAWEWIKGILTKHLPCLCCFSAATAWLYKQAQATKCYFYLQITLWVLSWSFWWFIGWKSSHPPHLSFDILPPSSGRRKCAFAIRNDKRRVEKYWGVLELLSVLSQLRNQDLCVAGRNPLLWIYISIPSLCAALALRSVLCPPVWVIPDSLTGDCLYQILHWINGLVPPALSLPSLAETLCVSLPALLHCFAPESSAGPGK